jgi:hypothetical protein
MVQGGMGGTEMNITGMLSPTENLKPNLRLASPSLFTHAKSAVNPSTTQHEYVQDSILENWLKIYKKAF